MVEREINTEAWLLAGKVPPQEWTKRKIGNLHVSSRVVKSILTPKCTDNLLGWGRRALEELRRLHQDRTSGCGPAIKPPSLSFRTVLALHGDDLARVLQEMSAHVRKVRLWFADCCVVTAKAKFNLLRELNLLHNSKFSCPRVCETAFRISLAFARTLPLSPL